MVEKTDTDVKVAISKGQSEF